VGKPADGRSEAMTTVTALMSSAVSSLNDRFVAESLCGTARALVEFCDKANLSPLRIVLENEGLACRERLDGWSLPDAVWTAIYRKRPRLCCYPLGEIAERAVKKTIITLTLQAASPEATKASPSQDESAIQKNLLRAWEKLGRKGLLKLFLSHYFFETCIDDLRRPGDDPDSDSSFEYHFSEGDRMVSLDAERELRQALFHQCERSAARFVPFLLNGSEEVALEDAEQRMKDGFDEVFDESLREGRKRRGQDLDKPFVNVIVGTGRPSRIRQSYTLDEKAKRFRLHADRPNVSSSFDQLRPHSLVKDLLDIGVAVYMSDLYTRRGRDLERRIGLLMPVRHPGIWEGARTELECAVSFLGRDDFSIHLVRRKERVQEVDFSIKSDERCVCLFSGGLDSMAGAVWALDSGRKPTYVSHYANPQLCHMQESLINQLGKIHDQELPRFGFYIAKAKKTKSKKPRYPLSRPPRSIMAQHLRSFLFLSLATAVALTQRIGKVYIFENGPVALNPLFSEARINTRTAHPHFLAYFQALIRTTFGVELCIENPFVYMTKGEVASILARPELHGLVAKTSSCWNWFRVPLMAKQLAKQLAQQLAEEQLGTEKQPQLAVKLAKQLDTRGKTLAMAEPLAGKLEDQLAEQTSMAKELVDITKFTGRHDGECLPCILRRTAMHHAGLWDKDAQYLTDIFQKYPELSNHTTPALADFLRLCKNVTSLSDAELLLTAPDLSVYEEGVDPRKLVEMYREHAREVIRCFRTRSNDEFQRDFASVLC
jgi:7-cyano-7-deazaguanine synthase in queuosine biosynthesis